MKTIIPKKSDEQREELDCDLEDLRQFIFDENEALKAKTIQEGIGHVFTFRPNETKADHSTAKGKGLTEAIVGIEANFVLTTKNAKGQQYYEKRDRVTVEIKNQQGLDGATEVQVKDNYDGSYKVSYFAKETGRCRAVVKVNEREARGSTFSVQVSPRQFTPVLSFGQQGSSLGRLSKPWGVAVNERNEIAVTDSGNYRVQVFSSDGTYLRSFSSKGNKQGEFNCPTGIAFGKNKNIIVVDNGNHRVQLFSEQGEYLSQFGVKGTLDHQLFYPHGLSIENDGNIIIADSYNKLIKIFSPEGYYLGKFRGEGSLTFPFHCIQYEKYLIVSDFRERFIKVFDRNGNFLYKFGKKGEGDGEFIYPRCLSVNKAGHLMVCEVGNYRVQVFDLSGKFITKSGSKGDFKGKFNNPVSVAVLSDGQVVVSDLSNHRIQIFE
ncbi:E3 ubiquitin-protein ligase TRIM71-like [Stylophora pistillata]|nr:E3 ubiquitin-protein ligase TRIM71-like [Stylophora pistillata]